MVLERCRGSWANLSDPMPGKPSPNGRKGGLSDPQAGDIGAWDSGPDDWTEMELARLPTRDNAQRWKQKPCKPRALPSFSKLSFAITGSLSGMFFMWSLLSSSHSNPAQIQAHQGDWVDPQSLRHPGVNPRKLFATTAFVSPGHLETAALVQAHEAIDKPGASANTAMPEIPRPAAEAQGSRTPRHEVEVSVPADQGAPKQAALSLAPTQADQVEAPKKVVDEAKVASRPEIQPAAPCRTESCNGSSPVGKQGPVVEPKPAEKGSNEGDHKAAEKEKENETATWMESRGNGEVQRSAAVRGGGGDPQKAPQATGGGSNAGGSSSAAEAEHEAVRPAVAASVATGDAKGVPAGLGKSDAAASTSLTLKEAVENVAGPDRMLIVASSTANYLDFAQNFLASAARIGRRGKVLMIAEDEEAFAFLHRIIPKQTIKGWEVAATELKGSAGHKGAERDHAFFNSVLARRPRYLLAILELNVTLLSSDVDNVFLKNPFYPSYFTGDYDLWLMQDLAVYKRDASWEPMPAVRKVTENYCTALLYMLPNDANKAMLRQLIANMDEHSRSSEKGVFEQTEWNLVLANSAAGLAVRVGVLSPFLFPTGCIYFSCRGSLRDQYVERLDGQEWSQVAIVLQNNWAQTHKEKVDRFKAHKMWFL